LPLRKIESKRQFFDFFLKFKVPVSIFGVLFKIMKNLYIVALFQFKENDIMDALELLKKLVIETRKEEGCLQYDLVEDRENKGVFFIVELWETEVHHHQHNGTDHLMNFRMQSASMLQKSAEVYKGYKTF
jgi:quinol monooxygenase YgiN